MADLGKIVADDPDPDPPVTAPVTAPAAAAPPATPAPAATTAEPPKVEVKPKRETVNREYVDSKVREAVDGLMRNLNAPPTAPAQPSTTAAPPAAPAADARESALNDIEKEELNVWRFAEAKMPEKYKGAAERYLAAIGQIDAYIDKTRKEDPERSLDEKDEELQTFITETLPSFSGADRRRLERMIITEEVTAQTRQEMRSEQDDLRKKQKELELRPQIERAVDQFQAQVTKLIESGFSPDDAVGVEIGNLVTKAKTEGWEPVLKADPFHAPIVKNAMDRAVRRANEYLALISQLKPFTPHNPDLDLDHPKNDDAWLAGFIRRQGEYLVVNGGEAKFRDENGVRKEFVPVHEFVAAYQKSPSEAQARFWTFSEADILSMLATHARADATARVKEEVDRLAAAGYQRQPAPAKPAAAPAPAKPAATAIPKTETPAPPSPKATVGVSPGAATPAPPNTNRIFGESDFALLGVPMPK